MYNQNYKVELPQFPDREVSIAEYGAKSGDLQIETGRHNAEAINRAICEVSEQGGGTVRVPAGIWAVAPLRLLSGVNLHLDSQAMLNSSSPKRTIRCGSPAMKVRTAFAPYLPLPRKMQKTSPLPEKASLTAAVINGVRSRSLR